MEKPKITTLKELQKKTYKPISIQEELAKISEKESRVDNLLSKD